MGEKIYTFGDKQASIIEFVILLIRSGKSKIHLRSSYQTRMKCHSLQTFHWHYKAYTYAQQTTQHTVIATFLFFDAGGCGIKP